VYLRVNTSFNIDPQSFAIAILVTIVGNKSMLKYDELC
jgi:hypothetical protein